jgi:hypothetical protein
MVTPVVTRVERYAGHCCGCGGTTLAPLPEGLEPGTPFSRRIYREFCVWGGTMLLKEPSHAAPQTACHPG